MSYLEKAPILEQAEGAHLLCRGRHVAKPRQAPHGAEPLSASCAALLSPHAAAGRVGVRPGRRTSRRSRSRIFAKSRRAAPTPCPMAPWCSSACCEHSQPDAVEVSVYGVREGLLYSKLPQRKRNSDALLVLLLGFRAALCTVAGTRTRTLRLDRSALRRRQAEGNAGAAQAALCRLPSRRYRLAGPSRLSRRTIPRHDLAGGLRRH